MKKTLGSLKSSDYLATAQVQVGCVFLSGFNRKEPTCITVRVKSALDRTGRNSKTKIRNRTGPNRGILQTENPHRTSVPHHVKKPC